MTVGNILDSGTANNAGAILVLGRDLIVVPKLIHPLPPTVISRDTSPDNHAEDTWMQVKIWVTASECPFLKFDYSNLTFDFPGVEYTKTSNAYPW